VTTIRKTVFSGSTPTQFRDQIEGLATAPLGDLALQLAADPDLTVSVITFDDGRLELEVLHTGPPHRTEDTIDCQRFTGQHPQPTSRTLSIATPTGRRDAVTMVCAILMDATAS
jgi:hypothetical protein